MERFQARGDSPTLSEALWGSGELWEALWRVLRLEYALLGFSMLCAAF